MEENINKDSNEDNESNFQLSVKSNPEFLWFCFTLLCDWSRKLVPLYQPIGCKKNTNLDLVARVFPRFAWLACSYSEFSLALRAFSFRMIGSWNSFVVFFTTISRKALYLLITVMILMMIMIQLFCKETHHVMDSSQNAYRQENLNGTFTLMILLPPFVQSSFVLVFKAYWIFPSEYLKYKSF